MGACASCAAAKHVDDVAGCAPPASAPARDALAARTCSKPAAASSGKLLTPRQVLELCQKVLAAPLRPADAAPVRQQQPDTGPVFDLWRGSPIAAEAARCGSPSRAGRRPSQPSPVMLAAIAVCESSGRSKLKQYSEDVGEDRLGLCQVTLSTAHWLAGSEGYTRHGSSPGASKLLDAEASLYYGASYLAFLQGHNGRRHKEEYVVRAFHAGPKNVRSPAAARYWYRYCKAKLLLGQLERAVQQLQGFGWGDAGCSKWAGAHWCTMHIVAPGESLSKIAAICGLAEADILSANLDLQRQGTRLQPGDCIALPLPCVPPRLYAVQPGDTLHSIAEAHGVTQGRLLSRNPEMRDPSNLHPGWLLALPGLKGDSSPPCEWSDMLERMQRTTRAQSHASRGPAEGFSSPGAAAAAVDALAAGSPDSSSAGLWAAELSDRALQDEAVVARVRAASLQRAATAAAAAAARTPPSLGPRMGLDAPPTPSSGPGTLAASPAPQHQLLRRSERMALGKRRSPWQAAGAPPVGSSGASSAIASGAHSGGSPHHTALHDHPRGGLSPWHSYSWETLDLEASGS